MLEGSCGRIFSMSDEQCPTILDRIGMKKFATETQASEFLNEAIKNGGTNETVIGSVVGPIVNKQGVESWGVELTVHRRYPRRVLLKMYPRE